MHRLNQAKVVFVAAALVHLVKTVVVEVEVAFVVKWLQSMIARVRNTQHTKTNHLR